MPELGKVAGKAAGFIGSAFASPDFPTFNADRNIATPAFNLSQSGGTVNLARLNSLRPGFAGILGELDTLKADVRPGFGKFTDSIREEFNKLRVRTLGNAKDALTRRRVAGSSFANNQLANLDAEVSRQERAGLAGAFIKEIEISRQLIDDSFNVRLEGVKADLAELNIAVGASDTMVNTLSEQAKTDKQLAADAIAGTGDFFREIGSDVGTLIGGSDNDLLGGLKKIFGGDKDRIALEAAKLFAGSGNAAGPFNQPNTLGRGQIGGP